MTGVVPPVEVTGLVAVTEVTVPVPFPLKIFQSVFVRYPLTAVVAAGIEIAGFAPPLLTTGAVPVTVKTPTGTSPEPKRLVPLTVFMFVPLTKAVCLPLKVFQSVLARYPLTLVVATGIAIVGVTPPVLVIGLVAATELT
jgi:hypothetical protein